MEDFGTCGRQGLTRCPTRIVSVVALAGLFVVEIGSAAPAGEVGACTTGVVQAISAGGRVAYSRWARTFR